MRDVETMEEKMKFQYNSICLYLYKEVTNLRNRKEIRQLIIF